MPSSARCTASASPAAPRAPPRPRPRPRKARSSGHMMRVSRASMRGNTALAYDYEVEPEPELIEIPIEQRKTLLQLTEKTCHWPIGDPGSADFFFCGGERQRPALLLATTPASPISRPPTAGATSGRSGAEPFLRHNLPFPEGGGSASHQRVYARLRRAMASRGGVTVSGAPSARSPPPAALRAATSPLQGEVKKAATHHRPYSLRRRVRRSPCPAFAGPSRSRILLPLGQSRGDGAPSGATFFQSCRALSCGERGRLSALHRGVFCGAGPRFLTRRSFRLRPRAQPFQQPRPSLGRPPPAVSELLAGGRMCPRTEPRRRPSA